MEELQEHPFAGIFPRLEGADLDALADDIAANGLHDPIWRYEGKVLDGRHRYRACLSRGVEPRYEDYEGHDPLGFVISRNLRRRHLTESQRAMVAVKVAANLQQNGATVRDAVAKAARVVNVSERSVYTAKELADSGVPELVAAVETGVAKVSAAAAVSKFTKAEQRKAVRERKVKAKAAEKRQERKAKKAAAAREEGEGEPRDEEQTSPACGAASPATESLRRVEALCRDMDRIAARMKALHDDPYCYAIHLEPAVAQVEAARKTLWQGRAAHPCPYCEASGGGGCKACNGTARVKGATRASGLKATGGTK